MKILFISRAYPPVWGGIEMQNYGIASALAKITKTRIVANKRGKKMLPLFLPWVFLKGFFLLPSYDAVLFGDGVLSPIGAFWKFFYPRKKFLSIIHGLDITFAQKKSVLGKIYRYVNIPSHKKMDKLIMVGNETIARAAAAGIPREKCVFIPNGLDENEICKFHSKGEMEKILGINLQSKKVIFRGGRFTRHKGVEWFIRNVMPSLPEEYILVAAGGAIALKTAGDENNYSNCEKAARELNLENRVKLLVNLPRKDIKVLFNACDLCISPNITVSGSMEGFGITAIEGAVCGKVVLASDIEGLKDAIINGENGFLVEHENAEAWISKINELLANDNFRREFGEEARQFVIDNYSWDKIAKKYLEEIKKTIDA